MSWSKSFRIPAGASTAEADSIIEETHVDPQPNAGYDPGEHRAHVARAREIVRTMVGTLGMRPGKDISVSMGGHTPCGEKDWGGSLSVNICHCDPVKVKE